MKVALKDICLCFIALKQRPQGKRSEPPDVPPLGSWPRQHPCWMLPGTALLPPRAEGA